MFNKNKFQIITFLLFLISLDPIKAMANVTPYVCFLDFSKENSQKQVLIETNTLDTANLCYELSSVTYTTSVDTESQTSYSEVEIQFNYSNASIELLNFLEVPSDIHIAYLSDVNQKLEPVIIAKLINATAGNIRFDFQGEDSNSVSSTQTMQLSYQKLTIEAYSFNREGENKKNNEYCYDARLNKPCEETK